MAWDEGLGLPMPQVPGGLGNAEAMTQMAAPVQRMATARVKKIFGVPVPERRARTFLGGLAAMPAVVPGGGFGNFLRGFSGGVGGALQQGNVYDESVRRDADSEMDNAYKQAMIDRMTRPDPVEAPADTRTSQQKNYDALVALGVDPAKARFSAFGAEEPSGAGLTEFDRYLAMDPGKRATYKEFKNLGDATNEANDAATEMDDATLRMTALLYAKTGQLPALGMGKGGSLARTKILNYAAHNFPQLDVASNKLDYSRNQKSLDNVTKIYDASSAWEETASRNADVMLNTLKSIPDAGFRLGNKVGRYLASQAGDPKVAAFNTARETIKVEYARLLSSPGVGNSVLSDAARKEVEGILSGDYTKDQMINALNVLKQDAKNRKAAYSAQIEDIRSRMAWNEAGAQTNAPTEEYIRVNGKLVKVER